VLALVEQGLSRDQAYRIVQRNATSAWGGSEHLRDLLQADPEVALSREVLTACFSTERFLANTAIVFERLEALELEVPES